MSLMSESGSRVLSGDGDAGTGGEHEEAVVDVMIPFVLVALALGILLRYISRLIPMPPYTVVIFTLAMVLAYMHEELGLGKLGKSIEAWQDVHPHVILFVFLPPLLFESALATDFHVFQRVVGPSLLLAVPGVGLSVTFTALIAHYVFPYNWDWNTSFLVGSILSATDPVAVVAVLKTLGAKKQLSILIEGESLLNDGSAFVLFLIFLEAIEGVDRSFGELLEFFCQLALGGPAWGLLCGFLLWGALKLVWNDPLIEVTSVLVAVFATFFVAENRLHVSGVLAVVTLGLFFSRSGKYAISRCVEHTHHVIWEHVAYFANTMIFALSGIIIYQRLFLPQQAEAAVGNDAENWGYLLALYGLLHVVRGMTVLILSPFLTHMGYGMSWKELAILVFGGLRGAVGLALALLVVVDAGGHLEPETLDLIGFHVGGIVFLTLAVNGSLAGMLYRKLKVYPSNKYHPDFVKSALSSLQHEADEIIDELSEDWFFRLANRRLVESIIPTFKDMKLACGHIEANVPSLETVFAKTKARSTLRKAGAMVMAGSGSSRSGGMMSLLDSMSNKNVPSLPGDEDGDETKQSDAVGLGDVQLTASTGPPVNAAPLTPVAPEDDLPPPQAKTIAARAAVAAFGLGVKVGKGADPTSGDGDGESKTATPAAATKDGSGGGNATPKVSLRALRAAATAFTNPKPLKKVLTRRASLFLPPPLRRVSTEARNMQSDEVNHRVFAGLRAMYGHMYEERDIESQAILVLTESVDVAQEYQDFFKSKKRAWVKQEDRHPFYASWLSLQEGLQKPRWLKTMEKRRNSCVKPLANLSDALSFEQVRFEVETLRAFILAHELCIPEETDRRAIGADAYETVVPRMHALVARARMRLNHVKHEFPGMMMFVRSTITARHALGEVRNRVRAAHSDRGLIDDAVLTDLLQIVDRRLHDLDAYLPSRHVIGLTHKCDSMVQDRDVEDDEMDELVAEMGDEAEELMGTPAVSPIRNRRPSSGGGVGSSAGSDAVGDQASPTSKTAQGTYIV